LESRIRLTYVDLFGRLKQIFDLPAQEATFHEFSGLSQDERERLNQAILSLSGRIESAHG